MEYVSGHTRFLWMEAVCNQKRYIENWIEYVSGHSGFLWMEALCNKKRYIENWMEYVSGHTRFLWMEAVTRNDTSKTERNMLRAILLLLMDGSYL
jgi:hypothetical protein